MSARSSRLARHWLAAAIAPLLLLGATGPVEATARCLLGAAQEHCCCHENAEATQAPVRIERRCCCEVDQPTAPAAPIQTAEAGGAAFAPSLVAIATATTEPHAFRLAVSVAPPLRAPAIGPPLILLKSSLLI